MEWTDQPVATRQALLDYLRPWLTPERWQRFEDVIQFRTRHLTVVLEDVFQERNAGAILRSCDCFGIQDVHIIENEHSHKVTHRIAKGAEKWLTTRIHGQDTDNTTACIRQLREQGYRIIATTPHEGESLLPDFDPTEPAALFFGAEQPGISEIVHREADGFLKIPLHGFTESFNVSVAAALILYQLTQRLYQSDAPWQLSEQEKLDLLLDWTIRTVRSGPSLARKFLADHVKN